MDTKTPREELEALEALIREAFEAGWDANDAANGQTAFQDKVDAFALAVMYPRALDALDEENK